MKHIFTILLSFACLHFTAGQNVNPTKLFVEGLKTVMIRYNELGAVKGTSTSIFQAASKSGQNIAITATSTSTEVISGSQLTQEIGYKMNTNTISNSYSFFIDMKYFLPFNIAYQNKNYALTVSGSAYEVPSVLTIGQVLNPITMNYTFTPSVAIISTASTTIRFMNRTVEKREKVTVPAGTFMCYLISEIVEIKTNTLTKQKVKRWINQDSGIIKTEVRDMSDNLIETEQLTQFQTPSVLNSNK